MESPQTPKLLLQAEKILPQPVHPNLIACCPTMDLVAVVNQDEQLNVYRFGGQRAFGLQRRQGAGKVVSLCWKFNGQYLAAGWSDGIVEVISAETGSVLQHFRQVTASGKSAASSNADSFLDITCVGWGLNFIDVPSVKAKIGHSGTAAKKSQNTSILKNLTTDNWDKDDEFASLDDFLDRIPDLEKVDIPLDLPEQLARVDVTSLLPKLPALPLLPPAAYKTGDHPAAELFSSQVSMDALLTANDPSQTLNGLDTLLLAQGDGTVRLILYDSLSIGKIALPPAWTVPSPRFLKHASHPFSQSHMFLAEFPPDGINRSPRTALIPLSLHFMNSAGSHLHMIEHKTAQLETLVQYVNECLLAINHHWTHAKELPGRFMENINETLKENDEPTLVQILFHLAVTGDCPPTLKEWLVDILAERGHKRWDHAISHGYTKILELTHENLLPALDRCSIILSHLKGLAEYHEHSPVFNVPVSAFEVILNIIRCMRLLAHHVLQYASEESRQFSVFSKWLRHEIDIQASDPASATADETAQQDMGTDYSQLLAYIQGPMNESRLDPFILTSADGPSSISAQSGMYEDMKKCIDAFKKQEESATDLINIHSHFDEWQCQNQILVDQITGHQRASSSMNCGIVLEKGAIAASDFRVAFEDELQSKTTDRASDLITTYTALVHEVSPSQVNVRRIVHSNLFDDIKTVRFMPGLTLSFMRSTRPSAGSEKQGIQIRDIKFVDDEHLILLLKEDDTSHLLSLKYHGDNSDFALDQKLPGDYSQAKLPHGIPTQIPVCEFQDGPGGWRSYIKHTFTPDDMLKPLKIEVNGRKNRRFVVVVGEDLRQLRILDLDFDEGHEHGEVSRTRNEDGDDVMSE